MRQPASGRLLREIGPIIAKLSLFWLYRHKTGIPHRAVSCISALSLETGAAGTLQIAAVEARNVKGATPTRIKRLNGSEVPAEIASLQTQAVSAMEIAARTMPD